VWGQLCWSIRPLPGPAPGRPSPPRCRLPPPASPSPEESASRGDLGWGGRALLQPRAGVSAPSPSSAAPSHPLPPGSPPVPPPAAGFRGCSQTGAAAPGGGSRTCSRPFSFLALLLFSPASPPLETLYCLRGLLGGSGLSSSPLRCRTYGRTSLRGGERQ